MHWYYADITWVSPLQFRSATTVVLNRLTWSLFLRYTALFFNQVNKRFFYRIRNCCEITKTDITEKHPFIKSLNLIAYKVFRLPSVMLMKLVLKFDWFPAAPTNVWASSLYSECWTRTKFCARHFSDTWLIL